ncbi:MAG: hypothetical protein PHV85_09620 [Desulfovibrionaceae bacterium]|nr:hypothetical protein [Desulfovibrionaceae bacterium]MDD4952794.1 hypothetical protein [Desulfovibrionaceae bacterium]
MATQTKFDAEALRSLVSQGKGFDEIRDFFGVQPVILKKWLVQLMHMDKTFYDVAGYPQKTKAKASTAKTSSAKTKKQFLAYYNNLLKAVGFELESWRDADKENAEFMGVFVFDKSAVDSGKVQGLFPADRFAAYVRDSEKWEFLADLQKTAYSDAYDNMCLVAVYRKA